MIIVSHEPHNIREHCNRACILEGGRLKHYDDVESAFADYDRMNAA
jgi:capsular polysaccharide transport system ATP-binding protein